MDKNPINFPNVKNLVNKIERLKLNKPTAFLQKKAKTKANTRKIWMEHANKLINTTPNTTANNIKNMKYNNIPTRNNRNNLFLSNAINFNNLVKPPLYSINDESLNRINKQIFPAKKPKYNFSYLIAKRGRGSNVTKKNRNTVRLQQLKDYIETTSNPRGKKAAITEYNRIMSEHNNTSFNLQ